MRLTLRTILAYLDDRLDPEHAREIGAKIEENARAGELVHRIRELMRSVRLAAPRMDRRAGGLDANTVAEYIDNHLSSERVADFERVCLDSDVYLGEVACCHQILSLALGEAARIDPASRQFMYGILKAHDAQATEAQAADTETAEAPAGDGQAAKAGADGAAPAKTNSKAKTKSNAKQPEVAKSEEADGEAVTSAAGGDTTPRKKRSVPEYLREKAPTSSRWRVAAVFGVALLLIGVVLMAIQPEWFTSLWRGSERTVATHTDAEPGPGAGGSTPSAVAGKNVGQPATPSASVGAPPVDPTAPDPALPQPSLPEPAPGSGGASPAAPGSGGADGDVTPKPNGDPAVPAPGKTPLAPNVAAPGGTATPPVISTEPEKPLTPPLATPPAEPAKAIGKLMSDGSVLLRSPLDSPNWRRVANKGDVFPGDTLVFPPLFRSTVSLAHGVTLQAPGETIVELLKPASPDAAAGVRLGTGRLVVLTVGEANARFPMFAGNRRAEVTLRDPGSTVGVEVKLIRTPGTDPIQTPSRVEVHVHVAAGSVTWNETPNGPELLLREGQGVVLGEGLPSEPDTATPPSWINSQSLTDGQRLTTIAVEEQLQKPKDADLIQSLLEIGVSRRYEERALGLRCLAWIDHFGPTIDTLGDDREHARWGVHAESLRQALSRGPLTAKQVLTAFQTKFPDEQKANELFRMLWGYSREQLADGDAAKLVDYLDHPEREFRVLASWNLVDITGKSTNVRTLVDGMDGLRRRIVLQWRQRLESGQITPPEPAAAPAAVRPTTPPAAKTP